MDHNETPETDPRRTDTEATRSRAGIQRSGTGHGGSPHASEPARPTAAEPSGERPAEEEGPVGPDGAQHAPTDRTADPTTWEIDAQGDVSRPIDDRNDVGTATSGERAGTTGTEQDVLEYGATARGADTGDRA